MGTSDQPEIVGNPHVWGGDTGDGRRRCQNAGCMVSQVRVPGDPAGTYSMWVVADVFEVDPDPHCAGTPEST